MKAYIISDAVLEFNIVFSPDNKKMLLVAELKKDKKIQKVTAKLFDASDFSKIWEKEPIVIYQKSTVSSFNYCIDNAGNFSYLFVFLRNDEEKSFMNGQNYYYYKNYAHGIGVIKANSMQNDVIAIPSTGITTLEPKLKVINNLLVCTGQYLEGEHMSRSADLTDNTGFFLLTVDPAKGELKTKSFVLLNEGIKSKLTYKDKGKRFEGTGNKEYENFEIFLSNNCFYQVIRRNTDDGTHFISKELIIYKYDQNNKFQWMKVIQRNTFDEVRGLNYLTSKKVYLFYYDLPDNLLAFPNIGEYDPKKYKPAKEAKKAVLICASIDDNGNITRQQIPTNGEDLILDRNNYLLTRNEKSKSILVPVHISSSQRRYDLMSLED